MPRANRHYLPGYVWHLTHRCHRKQFLLKFARDRRAWTAWLYAARWRYGLCVLDYTVTSNHVHLLVRDQGRGEIARSMQLIAGRSGQAYNRRKRRQGAFWEDRYHATAVESGDHLARCLVYIDLNMVRAGVVDHPAAWENGGYHEIQTARQRYRIVDRIALAEAVGLASVDGLAAAHSEWIEGAICAGKQGRQSKWSESVALGGRDFVAQVEAELGARARYRAIEPLDESFVLRDPSAAYGPHFTPESEPLRPNGN
jgi:putative transposase